MKSYREIADSVFARREQYVIAQRKKKQLVTRVTASVGSVALVSLAGIALLRSDAFRETPPLSDGGATTTTTHIPTEGEGTTTTTTTVNTTAPEPTTDGGIVTPPTTAPTTTAPAPSKPTATQAPTTGKTDPPKMTTTGTKGPATGYIPPIPTTTQPTTSTGSDRLLITGDEPDNSFSDQGSYSKNEIYISRSLQEKMNQYKGVDVTYAVIVAIPIMHEDWDEDFWASTEELVQFKKEYWDAYYAFKEEALLHNPSWDCVNPNHIEVWTDTMRETREYWLTLVKKEQELNDQPLTAYVESVLNRRFEVLKTLCEKEPVDIFCQTNLHLNVTHHAYYAELTADAINTLAEQGGYVFRLASGEPKNPIIDA